MKVIGGVPLAIAGAGVETTKHSDKTVRDSKAEAIGASPEVRLSPRARSLAAQAPQSFDPARVERLRTARTSGELSVDPPFIAKRMEEEN